MKSMRNHENILRNCGSHFGVAKQERGKKQLKNNDKPKLVIDNNLGLEIKNLRNFNSYTVRSGLLDETTQPFVEAAKDKIKEAKMPQDSENVALKELDRLSRIPTQSPEYNVSRTYIEWLTDLPWSKTTEDSVDLKLAKKILDEDHYGLDKVKESKYKHPN